LKLDQKGSIMAEYVWVDANGETRSKSRTLKEKDYKPADLPIWNFDGSSTEQAPGDNSDVYLRPAAVFPDPFRGSPNIIVLAECWNADGTPNKFNYRHECAKVMEAYADHEPWFGLEQEYTLLDLDNPPTDGPLWATLLLRALTTAVWAPARLSSVISSRPTTRPACVSLDLKSSPWKFSD
jgi:glutamine synthetase